MTFARHLRNNATETEHQLWWTLSRVRPRFTRQLPIGPFIADFACRRARVIVELDGSQHVDNAADVRRTALLESNGWRVVRFWNNEVWDNAEGVARIICEVVADRLPEGQAVEFISSRAGRARNPRTRKEEPPLAPPARAGGEQFPQADNSFPSTPSWRGDSRPLGRGGGGAPC